MTNNEIITIAANDIGFEYNGDNLKTFAQWKLEGYNVKKGEKAFMKIGLWILGKTKAKGKEKQETTASENDSKGDGEEKQSTFVMKTSFLFHAGQVEQMKKKAV